MDNPEIRRKHKETMQRPEVKAKFSGDNAAMKRPEVRALFTGKNSPAKRPEVRVKMSAAATIRASRPEERARLAAGARRQWQDSNYRHEMTVASRERMMDPVYKQRVLAVMSTPEARAKQAASQRGRLRPDLRLRNLTNNPMKLLAARLKSGDARRGRPLLGETKIKISAALKGRAKSAETRARMRTAQQMRRAHALKSV